VTIIVREAVRRPGHDHQKRGRITWEGCVVVCMAYSRIPER
jgi:hypothetical protein